MLVVTKPGADDRCGASEKARIAKIIVLIFAFDRPVRRKHIFEARANRVTVVMIGIDGESRRHAGDGNTDRIIGAPRITSLGIEQRGSKGVTKPAGRRAELIGTPRRDRSTGEYDATAAVARQPAILGFGTDHPIIRELIVEAALHATEEAGVAGVQAVTSWESAADMAANKKAGPIKNGFGRLIYRRLGIGSCWKIGREGWSRKDDCGGGA